MSRDKERVQLGSPRHVGGRIKEIRKRFGWSQGRFAEELGLSRNSASQVSAWERGQTMPAYESLERIVELADVDMSVFEAPAGVVEGMEGTPSAERMVELFVEVPELRAFAEALGEGPFLLILNRVKRRLGWGDVEEEVLETALFRIFGGVAAPPLIRPAGRRERVNLRGDSSSDDGEAEGANGNH